MLAFLSLRHTARRSAQPDNNAAKRLLAAVLVPRTRVLASLLLFGALVLLAGGFAVGSKLGPVDPRHGEIYRIIYLHVPATWIALILCAVFACCAAGQLFLKSNIASMLVESLAPTGAVFALLALWSGSLWARYTTGLWWDWDMPRIANLVLLCLFAAPMIAREVIDDAGWADRLSALIASAGAVLMMALLPSVALLPRLTGYHVANAGGHASAAESMIFALALATAGFTLYAAAAVLMRLRCVILERERTCEWISQWRTEK